VRVERDRLARRPPQQALPVVAARARRPAPGCAAARLADRRS